MTHTGLLERCDARISHAGQSAVGSRRSAVEKARDLLQRSGPPTADRRLGSVRICARASASDPGRAARSGKRRRGGAGDEEFRVYRSLDRGRQDRADGQRLGVVGGRGDRRRRAVHARRYAGGGARRLSSHGGHDGRARASGVRLDPAGGRGPSRLRTARPGASAGHRLRPREERAHGARGHALPAHGVDPDVAGVPDHEPGAVGGHLLLRAGEGIAAAPGRTRDAAASVAEQSQRADACAARTDRFSATAAPTGSARSCRPSPDAPRSRRGRPLCSCRSCVRFPGGPET